ncbi:hypothetical protein [Dactylosporangium sp. CA-139066]|uniref:hypothetical protein n=1 Tax=Dactylosporangium sp. CA-139066 TaxID=3239930 RepID=UPI003D8D1C5E
MDHKAIAPGAAAEPAETPGTSVELADIPGMSAGRAETPGAAVELADIPGMSAGRAETPCAVAEPVDMPGTSAGPADTRGAATEPGAGRRRPDDRIVASLALGVAGLFLFNVVFGPLAIVLGLWALRRPSVTGRGRGFAGLGVVLGLADLVVLAILVIGGAHGGSLLHVSA